jgi:hypothetical protein
VLALRQLHMGRTLPILPLVNGTAAHRCNTSGYDRNYMITRALQQAGIHHPTPCHPILRIELGPSAKGSVPLSHRQATIWGKIWGVDLESDNANRR